MARLQIALNVDDFDAAVAFYSKLFASPPAKHRPGYANFVLDDPPLKLSLLTEYGRPGTVDHIGMELADRDEVTGVRAHLLDQGLPVKAELDMVCCYSMQHKAWVDDPDGARWEFYTVIEDTEAAAHEGYGGAAVRHRRRSAAIRQRVAAVRRGRWRSRRARQLGRRIRRRARTVVKADARR